jgi:hypothetical protein
VWGYIGNYVFLMHNKIIPLTLEKNNSMPAN